LDSLRSCRDLADLVAQLRIQQRRSHLHAASATA
jgi:hypothetical protein